MNIKKTSQEEKEMSLRLTRAIYFKNRAVVIDMK